MAKQLTIRVIYPLQNGRIVLRTGLQWDRDIEAVSVSPDRTVTEFRIDSDSDFIYFKPCIIDQNGQSWSKGRNYLGIMNNPGTRDIYPYFFAEETGRILRGLKIRSGVYGGDREIGVYLPPGYDENRLKKYPVLYMHDGDNLFGVGEKNMHPQRALADLDAMNIIDKVIVVGMFAGFRNGEYTEPGYNYHARYVVDELKPTIDHDLRTLGDPRNTAVMGASLGGLVSFVLAWWRPDVFGKAACLSSTFAGEIDGRRWNLIPTIDSDLRKPDVRFYLDSGWLVGFDERGREVSDNYEETRTMCDLLKRRGYEFGHDLLYFSFPGAMHSEIAWGARCHIPFQFFFGQSARA
jgi:predicted alpha/beta superfamily hydrolase